MKIIFLLASVALAMANNENFSELLKESNDAFTSRMFAEVVKSNPGTSVVLSAYSVLPPLGQLTLASVGPSHDELLRAIGFPNDEVTKSVFRHAHNQLRSVKGIELTMANKIYIRNGYHLNNEFAVTSRDVFNSEVQNLDFTQNKAAVDTINSWVESQTNNRIKDLVTTDMIDSSTVSVLVNALYFKGSWNEKFNKDLTKDRPFHVTKDKTINIPTMYKRDYFRYGESAELNAKFIELPYEGKEATLFVALPNDIDGLAALQDKLKDPKVLSDVEQKMYEVEVDVYLPKTKIETTTNLKEVLQKMQITKLFTPGQAGLKNLLKEACDLFVSDAIQKAFIEINEEGTEAAAANVLIAMGSSALGPPQFMADRPFYFALKAGNLSIFNGVFYQP